MYRAPVKDIRFVLDELIGAEAAARLPGIRRLLQRDRRRRARRGGAVRGDRARAALQERRSRGRAAGRPTGVTMPEGFKEAYQQFCDNGWPALRSKAEFGGQNVPTVLGTAVEELWAVVESRLQALPHAHAGRHRGHPAFRHAAAEAAVPAEDGERRVDRHHEPDRAAGRQRSRAGAHARRARRA